MTDVLRYQACMINPDFDHMLGPDMHGRYLTIKKVTYDHTTKISTATLRAVLPDEFRERIVPLVAGQRERERIRALFNGTIITEENQ